MLKFLLDTRRFSRFFNAVVELMCNSVTASGTLQGAASLGCLRGTCVRGRLQAQSWQGNPGLHRRGCSSGNHRWHDAKIQSAPIGQDFLSPSTTPAIRGDFEVAEQLLHILEMMLTRRPLTPDGTRRRNMESLVAAHERLWHLRHPTSDEFGS